MQTPKGMPKGLRLDTDYVDDEPVPEPELELGSLSEGFFTEADADGDGFVTKSEFIQWHKFKYGRAPTPTEMKGFYEADDNGDGSISKAEFDDYMSSKVKRKKKLSLQTSFAGDAAPDEFGPVPEPVPHHCTTSLLL